MIFLPPITLRSFLSTQPTLHCFINFLFYKKLTYFYYIHIRVFCVHVWLSNLSLVLEDMQILVSMQARRGHQMPWNWSSRRLWAVVRCWEPNLGPLEEQPVPLIAEPSFQPQSLTFKSMYGGAERQGVGTCTWVHIEVHALGALELQLQVVVSNSAWMLGAHWVLCKGSMCS